MANIVIARSFTTQKFNLFSNFMDTYFTNSEADVCPIKESSGHVDLQKSLSHASAIHIYIIQLSNLKKNIKF